MSEIFNHESKAVKRRQLHGSIPEAEVIDSSSL